MYVPTYFNLVTLYEHHLLLNAYNTKAEQLKCSLTPLFDCIPTLDVDKVGTLLGQIPVEGWSVAEFIGHLPFQFVCVTWRWRLHWDAPLGWLVAWIIGVFSSEMWHLILRLLLDVFHCLNFFPSQRIKGFSRWKKRETNVTKLTMMTFSYIVFFCFDVIE